MKIDTKEERQIVYAPKYEINEEVELFDSFIGAWFEGKIINIEKLIHILILINYFYY